MFKKIKSLARNLQQIYFNLSGHNRFDVFVILANARTGSNLLRSLLDSHPDIKAYGEIFSLLKESSTEDIWSSHVESKKSKKIKWVGFKLFYNHPRDSSSPKIWDLIKANNSIKIIHLTREDILKMIVSKEVALKTKKYVQFDEKENTKTVSISPDKFLRKMDKFEKTKSKAEAAFTNHQTIHISYEDLVLNQEQTLQSVLSFLGANPLQKLSSAHKKQNPRHVRQIVDNYDELKESLADTKYASLFD